MTLNELFASAYAWADHNAVWILLGAGIIPIAGALLARIGKGGKTDADGRLIASLVVGFALVAFVVEVVALMFARSVLHKDVFEANGMLVAAPIACLVLSLILIRWVFPLNKLASVRVAVDCGAFVLACWGVLWLFGRFHWGVLFIGSLTQLAIILGLMGLLLYSLYRRAFVRSTP